MRDKPIIHPDRIIGDTVGLGLAAAEWGVETVHGGSGLRLALPKSDPSHPWGVESDTLIAKPEPVLESLCRIPCSSSLP
jgi:hypothetical protein